MAPCPCFSRTCNRASYLYKLGWRDVLVHPRMTLPSRVAMSHNADTTRSAADLRQPLEEIYRLHRASLVHCSAFPSKNPRSPIQDASTSRSSLARQGPIRCLVRLGEYCNPLFEWPELKIPSGQDGTITTMDSNDCTSSRHAFRGCYSDHTTIALSTCSPHRQSWWVLPIC